MNRDQVTELIQAPRIARGLSWAALAEAIGRPLVWTTAALLGQHPLDVKSATVLADLLDLPAEAVPILGVVPVRAANREAVLSDPTVYRFQEALLVYGPALKELIHEQFGDGIMSAINFSLEIARRPHPGGERVVVTFDGKFLPYDWVRAD